MTREKEIYRIFIGTYLEDKSSFADYDSIKNYYEEIQWIKARWVSPDNLHFTWKFLGNITQSRINRTFEAIQESIKHFKPINIEFNTVEIWPKPSSPKLIVWCGTDLNDNMAENYNVFDKGLKQAGFTREKRPFKPHITLARIKTRDQINAPLAWPEDLNLQPTRMKVNKIAIIKSDLLPGGPVYNTVKEIVLSD